MPTSSGLTVLARLERAFERLVTGSVAGVFRLRVQPAEIGRQLERAMLERRATSVGTTLAPNRYLVRLHPDDAAFFAGWEDALCREMEGWLAEVAFARGLAAVGPIQVEITTDPAVPRRAVQAESTFASSTGALADHRLERRPAPAMRLVPEAEHAPSGNLKSRTLTVGRALGNDLVVNDPEVSRFHARFEQDGDGWRLTDLGSTNGTWVNGNRVRQAVIAPGDEITFGETRYILEPG
jgi:hypothetical protein